MTDPFVLSLWERPGLVRGISVPPGQSLVVPGAETLGPTASSGLPQPLFCVDCQQLLIQEAPSKVGAAIFPKCKLLNKVFCAFGRPYLLFAFVDCSLGGSSGAGGRVCSENPSCYMGEGGQLYAKGNACFRVPFIGKVQTRQSRRGAVGGAGDAGKEKYRRWGATQGPAPAPPQATASAVAFPAESSGRQGSLRAPGPGHATRRLPGAAAEKRAAPRGGFARRWGGPNLDAGLGRGVTPGSRGGVRSAGQNVGRLPARVRVEAGRSLERSQGSGARGLPERVRGSGAGRTPARGVTCGQGSGRGVPGSGARGGPGTQVSPSCPPRLRGGRCRRSPAAAGSGHRP